MKVSARRIIYGIIGIAGAYSFYFMFHNLAGFWNTMRWTAIPYVLLAIGGVNWGITAIFGKDLMEIFRVN